MKFKTVLSFSPQFGVVGLFSPWVCSLSESDYQICYNPFFQVVTFVSYVLPSNLCRLKEIQLLRSSYYTKMWCSVVWIEVDDVSEESTISELAINF
jgi:hypothetical protein